MQQIAQSPMFLAVGFALIKSMGHFAALWLMLKISDVLLKRNIELKYNLYAGAQIAGFILFIASITEGYLSSFRLNNALTNTNQHFLFTDTVALLNSYANRILPYIASIYFAFLLVFIFRLVNAIIYTQKLKNTQLAPIPDALKLFVQEKSQQLNIKKSVELLSSSFIPGPLTIGFLKPIIIVPISCINNLSATEMEAILLHELAHIKRYDYLLNVALSVIDTIMYFNPFARLINNEIKKLREYCCDDLVLQHNYPASLYAQALVNIATPANHQLLALCASEESMLLSRIKRMVSTNKSKKSTTGNLLTAIVPLIAILLLLISPEKNIQRRKIEESKPATSIQYRLTTENPIAEYVPNIFIRRKPSADKKFSKIKINPTTIIQDKSIIDQNIVANNNAEKNISSQVIQTRQNARTNSIENEIQNLIINIEQAIKQEALTKTELRYINNELVKLLQLNSDNNKHNSNETTPVIAAVYNDAKGTTAKDITTRIENILTVAAERNNASINNNDSTTQKVIIIEIPQPNSDTLNQIIITEKLLKSIKL